MEEDWKFLIVLDACRYDYFSETYRDFFNGKLEKRISPGCSTVEWLQNSFQDYYSEVIYISGNPFINSKIRVAGFDAKRHFYKVVDVWRFGWDDKIGTVPPEVINKTTLKYYLKYPEKRFIVHYLQPHAPYLSAKFQIKGYPKPNFKNGSILTGVANYKNITRHLEVLINIVGNFLWKTGLIESVWELRERIGLPPLSPMDAFKRKYGKNCLIEAYKENLKIVLEYVAKLCKKVSGKKVITSDHGELLGEEGYYEHPNGPIDKFFHKIYPRREKILREVPWLIIS